jgi:hypothetical protein
MLAEHLRQLDQWDDTTKTGWFRDRAALFCLQWEKQRLCAGVSDI